MYLVQAFLKNTDTTRFVYEFKNRRLALARVSIFKRFPGIDLIECWSSDEVEHVIETTDGFSDQPDHSSWFGPSYNITWKRDVQENWIRVNNNADDSEPEIAEAA